LASSRGGFSLDSVGISVDLRVLTAPLGLVVLLAIFDQSPSPLRCSFLALSREPVFDGLFTRRVVQLFLVAPVRLIAVLSLGVTLRSFLIALAHRCSSL